MDLFSTFTILAQAAEGAAPQGGGGLFGGGGMGGMMMPMLIIFGIMYFMMLRPQQRKEKERQRMISELRAGQRVVFAGGIAGTVVEARERTFLIEVAPGVKIEVERGAVSRVVTDDENAKKA